MWASCRLLNAAAQSAAALARRRVSSDQAAAASAVLTSRSGKQYRMPDDLLPRKVNDRWREPRLSRRRIAELRKDTIAAGIEWKYDHVVYPNKALPKPVVKPKGHKRDFLVAERFVYIYSMRSLILNMNDFCAFEGKKLLLKQ